MSRTRAKICGITREQDGLTAVQYGADAIGLVFYAPSPRAVGIEQAQRITAALPPFVTVVALFVNPDSDEVREVLQQVPVTLLQFHGDESPEFCASFGRPYIKAIRMGEGVDLHHEAEQFASAQGLLLDSFSAKARGGTGEVFDWGRIPQDVALPLLLAGGLHPANVADAIRESHPYAVDVSSGVEIEKGIKGETMISDFMRAVARADSE
ncbi:N-(5'-phosphoribosyl)anthranilate isomerase [Solemya pervernicosa gill symbiont]|uniref:N-(5'-phosphoribosyl)anthranilate isomerase n=2 Tax=Gammaproteobacteria incertae sedis TaxID=118884 RepID=A0A1T2L6U2_9GAMM|nr:phosphoribosylanthranilate isomerase [Candidatus Reidiella endopervernicosa]OOZ40819.1 N-(5'-phosphoribosyl)anthranilate isomerase [Solemya pervernicosa gill symbiont]QKQ26330.1 phosphoribosylanthranilate isomerase [Candidatus Reidiella endopervernicosa]